MSFLETIGFYIRYYTHKHRNLAVGGATWGIIAAMFFGLHSSSLAILGLVAVHLLLGWPLGFKQTSGRVWLLCIVGMGLSFFLIHFTAHLGRGLMPLVVLGFVGSAICGSLLICLRYRPFDLEPSQSAT